MASPLGDAIRGFSGLASALAPLAGPFAPAVLGAGALVGGIGGAIADSAEEDKKKAASSGSNAVARTVQKSATPPGLAFKAAVTVTKDTAVRKKTPAADEGVPAWAWGAAAVAGAMLLRK